MLVDTHCHLAAEAFAADRPDVLRRARAAGVERVVVIGESPAAAETAFRLAESEPMVSVATGTHPHDATEWDPERAAWLRAALERPGAVALGEIGLDYHYDHSPRDVQRRAFESQLALAVELGLPAVIHAREADADVLAVLRNAPRAPVILHSFSSGPALLEGALALGALASFSGMVTFKSWTGDDLIRLVPLDRLLVETDAPYLAPVPHRGKRNEPGFVRQVADRVAQVRGMPVEELIAATGANAARVFGLSTTLA
ncbi:MAG TPA: TatD family hydrolase [Gemmatimonadales bacterium]|nr:TatD family hydrolase [Gemmatimonadales bacterium]